MEFVAYQSSPMEDELKPGTEYRCAADHPDTVCIALRDGRFIYKNCGGRLVWALGNHQRTKSPVILLNNDVATSCATKEDIDRKTPEETVSFLYLVNCDIVEYPESLHTPCQFLGWLVE